MNFFTKILIACSVFALAACDSDNNNNRGGGQPTVEFATVQVFHGSSDAPTVNVIIDGNVALSGVDFLQASNFISVEAGTHTIQIDGILPGGATVTVIPETQVTLDADTIYTISAINNVANIEPSIISQSDAPVAAGSARVFVLHGTPGAVAPDFSLPVDVHVTAPGGALDMPLNFDFRGTIGPVELPAGDYQIRVFLAGSTDEADRVYDSGTIPLGDGDDLRLVAVPNTAGGPGALTLAGLTPSGPVTILDAGTPTGLRLGHLSPDTPAVDVYANGAVYAGGVPYPTVTGFAPLPAGTYTVSVAPAGTMNDVIGPVDLPFDAGTLNSVLVVDTLDTITTDPNYLPIILRDDARPYATNARVRVIHAAPGAPTVDVYVVPVDPMMETDITNVEPTLADFDFRTVTDYLSLAEGDYDVIVTGVDSKDPVIGPKTISIANGGVYTAIARQPGGDAMDFDVIVLADVLNDET
jgi:hypothetical protein